MTNQPLQQALLKPEAFGRLLKWSVELSEFDITYRPRAAIKAQTLVDFMAECTEPVERTCEGQSVGEAELIEVWLIMINGSCNEQGAGAGIVICSSEGVEISYAVKFEFQVTNNQAEYEAFITGLKLAHALRAERIEI